MIVGMIRLYMRHGFPVDIPAQVKDEQEAQTIVGEVAEDLERTPAGPAPSPLGQPFRLFQLRPGIWVRRGEVVAVAFCPVGE